MKDDFLVDLDDVTDRGVHGISFLVLSAKTFRLQKHAFCMLLQPDQPSSMPLISPTVTSSW
jgi:hypothetical protein